jgi:hypothetical protein
MMQHSTRMQRRTLLKYGFGGLVIVGLGGAGAALWRPGVSDGRLTEPGREIFTALALAILDGCLPAAGTERAASLRLHLERLDAAVAAFPRTVQAELSQLLAVLRTRAGRYGLARLGVPWRDASVAEVQRSLEGMRMSRSELRQQAYHALRDLTNAAYFADASSWSCLGYPGPTAIGSSTPS